MCSSSFMINKGQIGSLSLRTMESEPWNCDMWPYLLYTDSERDVLHFTVTKYPATVDKDLGLGLIALDALLQPLKVNVITPPLLRLGGYLSVVPLFQEAFSDTLGIDSQPQRPAIPIQRTREYHLFFLCLPA